MNAVVKLVFTAILITHGMRSAAFAQAQAQPDQKTCANNDANSGGKNLSDKLSQSGGVICPPSTGDPDVKAPPSNGSKMPVIPPPGSPGGNPNVQPK